MRNTSDRAITEQCGVSLISDTTIMGGGGVSEMGEHGEIRLGIGEGPPSLTHSPNDYKLTTQKGRLIIGPHTLLWP